MRANPFAILISSTDAGPFATHLPLFVREEEEKVFLRGHVAKANPHWRYLEQQAQCLTIFHGPHAYISPGNYTAQRKRSYVELCGGARLWKRSNVLLRQDLHQMLHELMETFEPAYRLQWEQLSQKYRENMLRQIVGFEIVATKIEGKFKLSQNRTRQDQANVITSLEKAEDSAVSGVARMMREQRLGKVEGEEESE